MIQVADTQTLSKFDVLANERRRDILMAADALAISGTRYYVSEAGSDENDGRTPETAWRTLGRVSAAELCQGDGVFFRRGDLFRGEIHAASGVNYGAYGEGEKPRLYGGDEPLNDPDRWHLIEGSRNVWKWETRILDVGTLIFNGGERHSVKQIPSYRNGRFVLRNDESVPFDLHRHLTGDLDLFWCFTDKMTVKPSKGEDFPVPDCQGAMGELYLRCDAGNPAEVFDSIEPVSRRAMFYVGKNANVHIDNLCIRYVGIHGIAAYGSRVEGLHVTNCELGWIGGTIQNFTGCDPNYPEGRRGSVTRFGNAIEIYGGCRDYLVENCYIYQCYDAGITHQVTTEGKTVLMEDILYRNNLVEYCVYGIEYFLDMNKGDVESTMNGVEICGNIIRHSGYGWGQQRHNAHTPAHIKGWSYVNAARNFSIHHNVFDRANYRMLHLVAREQSSCPEMWENTYVQHNGKPLGQYGGNRVSEPPVEVFDRTADKKIAEIFGERDATVYWIEA